jgi:ketosteroid isomerase-like protein
LLTICFVLSAYQTAFATARSNADDVAAIRQVVESFRTSIINKDKATYMRLFFSDKPEDIGWQFVSEDTRLEHIRKTKPDAIKARQIPTVNFVSLIDGVVATKEPREETFSNISVDTDGEIASVSFDYTFLANGKATNWGREMWQLVRTEDGWKIFSVVFTIRDKWSVGEG